MNHMQILKRAWSILWSYRALWIFGIIMALTAPRPGNNGSGNNGVRFDQHDSNFPIPSEVGQNLNRWGEQMEDAFRQGMAAELTRSLIVFMVITVLFILTLTIGFTILRLVAQTALIKMVDRYESSGEKVTWRQGFRLGWSKEAWRLFLTNLAVYGPLFLIVLVLAACAAAPLLISMVPNQSPSWQGVVATIGLAFLVIFVLFIVFMLLSLVMEIIYRVSVLQGTGIMDGIRQGWQLVRQNLMDVFVMWLILVGIQIAFIFVLIPVIIVVGILGLLAGFTTGVAAYLVANVMGGVTAGWISAAVVGMLLFFLIFIPPLAFVGGLLETYLSTVWTMVYRELTLPGPVSEEPVNPEPTPDELALPDGTTEGPSEQALPG